MSNVNKKLIAYMNSFSEGSSGSDIVFIEIAKRISNDYDLVVVTSENGKQLCKTNGLEAKYIITTTEKSFDNIYKIYIKRVLLALFKSVGLKKGDILLATSDFLPDVFPVFLRKIFHPHIRWVQHVFHIIPHARKVAHFGQIISLIIIWLFADVVVVDNKDLKEFLVSKGIPEKKLHVNYLGIRKFKTDPDVKEKYEAVFMARLKTYKGMFDVIEIWKKVVDKFPGARLGIIGKGEPYVVEILKEKIKENNLENNIDLLGFLPNIKAFSLIENCKVFLLPSHEEGFGLVGLESQTLGVPVVAWDIPVFDEVFPKGMINVKFGDMQGFADEIVKILEDKNYQRQLSQESLQNAKRFSWEKTVERELELFNMKL